MVGPFSRLAVGLAAIPLLTQQQADQLLAHREALTAQRRGDVALTAADPAQRCFRVAADRILNQSLERRHQTG